MNALKTFFLDEWYFSAPMTLMAFAAFTLVAWRFLLNWNAGTDLNDLWPDLQETLATKGIRGAVALCKAEKGVIPTHLFVPRLEAPDHGAPAMRPTMLSAMELDVLPRLNFLLAPIIAIGKIATMVGLLGTVISMINTFSAISAAKAGDPGAVQGQAGAIGLALFATAMGLMTAIPLVFTHVLFKDWVHRQEVKMKAAGQKLVTLVQNARRPTAAAV